MRDPGKRDEVTRSSSFKNIVGDQQSHGIDAWRSSILRVAHPSESHFVSVICSWCRHGANGLLVIARQSLTFISVENEDEDLTVIPPKDTRIMDGIMEKKALSSEGIKWQVSLIVRQRPLLSEMGISQVDLYYNHRGALPH